MRRILLWITFLAAFGSPLCAVARGTQAGGLFVVIVNDKCGYIDRTGNIVIEPRFHGADQFSEGLASVAVSDNGYAQGYIDETGKIVIKPQFDIAGRFSEGVAPVGFEESRTDLFGLAYRWGYIDQAGRYLVEPKYSSAFGFSEGLAVVKEPDGDYYFINKAGQAAIPQRFKYAGSFSDGLACVMIGGKYGFIDKSGQVIIKPQFSSPGTFSEGLALVRVGGNIIEYSPSLRMTLPPGGRYVYIDKTGNALIRLPAEVENAQPFSEGLAAIEVKKEDGRLCGYIGQSGETLIEPKFGGCKRFSDGMAMVTHEGKIQYVDKEGKITITTPYEMAWDFRDGLAFVQSGDGRGARWGYIDKTGKVVWPPSK